MQNSGTPPDNTKTKRQKKPHCRLIVGEFKIQHLLLLLQSLLLLFLVLILFLLLVQVILLFYFKILLHCFLNSAQDVPGIDLRVQVVEVLEVVPL